MTAASSLSQLGLQTFLGVATITLIVEHAAAATQPSNVMKSLASHCTLTGPAPAAEGVESTTSCPADSWQQERPPGRNTPARAIGADIPLTAPMPAYTPSALSRRRNKSAG